MKRRDKCIIRVQCLKKYTEYRKIQNDDFPYFLISRFFLISS